MANASRFKFPKGCDIRSITIREANGDDEIAATGLAKAKGEGYNPTDEMVRLSIVAVDDKPVSHPFGAYDKWNTKTRGLVFAAWKKLNAADEKEIADFFASAEDAEVPPAPAIDGTAKAEVSAPPARGAE